MHSKLFKSTEITFSSVPESADIEFLTQAINSETLDFGAANAFGFFLKDNENNIIAGCNGSVVFGIIFYTDQLWVARKYRSTD